MDYLILNSNGSIKSTKFVEPIQQNNDGVNSIFVHQLNTNMSGKDAYGVFTLPDGTVTEERGIVTANVEFEDNETLTGWVIPITQNETRLAGLVFLTIQIREEDTNHVLYSYRVALTINATADQSSSVLITMAQYNTLLEYIRTMYNANLVPYTGATQNVDLGNKQLLAGGVKGNNIQIGNVAEKKHAMIISPALNDNNDDAIRLLKYNGSNSPECTILFPAHDGTVLYQGDATLKRYRHHINIKYNNVSTIIILLINNVATPYNCEDGADIISKVAPLIGLTENFDVMIYNRIDNVGNYGPKGLHTACYFNNVGGTATLVWDTGYLEIDLFANSAEDTVTEF